MYGTNKSDLYDDDDNDDRKMNNQINEWMRPKAIIFSNNSNNMG